MKSKVGVVIGRFQPLHNGHILLFEEANRRCEELIIIICSPSSNADNLRSLKDPFSYPERMNWIQTWNNEPTIYYVDDVPDDKEWVKYTSDWAGDQPFTIFCGDDRLEYYKKIFTPEFSGLNNLNVTVENIQINGRRATELRAYIFMGEKEMLNIYGHVPPHVYKFITEEFRLSTEYKILCDMFRTKLFEQLNKE